MGFQPDSLTSALAEAKVAIERGDYGLAVRLLEPLCEHHSPLHPGGDSLRLLLATALMGQGQTERAAACCRSLQGCSNPQRRAQARDLLQVLEAPALKRPRNWSLTLPRLDQAAPLEGVAKAGRSSRRPKVEAPDLPPVGPTQNPRGFVVVVTVVLVGWLLSVLLTGCLRVETQLTVAGPGRMELRHRLEPIAGTPLPFQAQLAEALAAATPAHRVRQDGAVTLLQSPLLSPDQAAATLQLAVEKAAGLAGFSLPPPVLDWQESNWLLGVHQHIQMRLDLRPLPSLPGVELRLRLFPFSQRSIRSTHPLPVEPSGGGGQAWIWPLKLGEINTLEIHCWRWNPLGLGSVVVAAGLVLVVQLQRMRIRLGLGLPELPA